MIAPLFGSAGFEGAVNLYLLTFLQNAERRIFERDLFLERIMNMFDTETIRVDHKDVIHDVNYDYYGNRMATCSSDQTVKVWDKDEQDKWVVTSSWKAHSGSIWRLSWAHPEFGQVIATCSFDRTVSVWEENFGEKVATTMAPSKRWTRKTTLVDSRTSVTDVKFAPKHLGLLLATASADGIIRIYEAPDIMNLSQWSLQHEIACKLPLSCLSWNKSLFRLHAPLIAAGSDETSTTSGGKVFIFEYSENARKWAKVETVSTIIEPVHDIAFAPTAGRSYHILSIASKDLHILHLKQPVPVGNEPGGTPRLDIQTSAQFSDHYCHVWRVCWNITGTMLASTGDDGCVRIWKMNYMKNWKCAGVLKAESGQSPSDSLLQVQQSSTSVSTPTITKYIKKGTSVNQGQVPWH